MTDIIKQWQAEETAAFQGWDFSRLDGRWDSPSPTWDYVAIVKSHLKDTDILLDMGTGGGEVLFTIGHPHKNTYVTEAYEPNVELCRRVLAPLGITVVQTFLDDRLDQLPFEDEKFDIIINRHESFDLNEINRTLKPGGYFITQQVGGKHCHELTKRLCDHEPDHPGHSLEEYAGTLKGLGFEIEKTADDKHFVKFFDVGALVYYAKIIEWDFPNFSVENCLGPLMDCHREIEENGFVQGTGGSFIIVARKP